MFEAREQVEMWADVVEARSGRPAEYPRRLVAAIDAYRAERGWSPHGFGGETDGTAYAPQSVKENETNG
jgi:hypothetical protein